jgi:hypothetical protein
MKRRRIRPKARPLLPPPNMGVTIHQPDAQSKYFSVEEHGSIEAAIEAARQWLCQPCKEE